MREPQVRLEELIEPAQAGYWGSESATSAGEVICRVVRNGDVGKDGVIAVRDLPQRWMRPKEVVKALVKQGDSILVSSGAYTGNVGKLDPSSVDEPVVVSNFVRRLRPRPGVDGLWLYHLLRSSAVQAQVWPHTGGSAIPNLGSSFYSGAKVPFSPPLPEQRRIAEILDTVDEAIQRTEELIAKLEEMKKGFLHDLLSRGIDENGELRDPERHPEEFKNSPVGRIPRTWTLKPLEDLVAMPVTYGVVQPGPIIKDGVPFVRGGDFPRGVIEFSKLRTISPEVSAQYQRTQLQGGEVLVSLVGQPGASAVVSRELAGANIARQTALVRLKPELSPRFLHAYMRTERAQRSLLGDTLGSVQQVINLRDLKRVEVPVASMAEQGRINTVVQSIGSRVDSERTALAKLRSLKGGLMNDLLTGRVRVSVPEPEEATA